MWLPTSGVVLLAFAIAPFSHKQHAALKVECTTCHATAATGERAGFPDASVCAGCHTKYAGKSAKIEPDRSVYQLAEFVHFSHARHAAAKLVCRTCHGQVWEMDEVKQVLPMTMKACMTCHYAMRAPTKCIRCHDLGQ